MTSHRALLVCFLTLTLPALTRRTTAAESAPRRPNIVFILADDLGWTDLACQGSQYYETPSIDRLASQGMRLRSFYNCQNCTPTRAALMSGQYPTRTGVFTVNELTRGREQDRRMVPPANRTTLPLDRKTIADQLKAAGYATGIFGKWHIGQQGDYHPLRRGFDEGFVTMGKHFDFVTNPPVEVPPGAYLADFLTDRALGFIEKHKDRPFFLYLPHFGVHSPHQAKQTLIEKYRDKPPAGGHGDPTYAAMIQSLDESVGRIMAKLEELKLADNTVLIFASDNGGVGGYRQIGGRGVTDNAPLRGGKGMLYEGGVRVPFIVRWPGVITPATLCDEPAIHVDIFPTFLEIAGAPRPPQVLDGASLLPLFRDAAAKLPREALYVHFPGYLEGYGTNQWRTAPVGTIRAGDWKLMEFFEDGRLELYNLAQDLGEKNNLAAALPEKAAQLQKKLAAWRQETNAAMPTPKTQPQAGAAPDASPPRRPRRPR